MRVGWNNNTKNSLIHQRLQYTSKRWQNTNTAAKNYETLKIKRMLQQNEESKTHNTDNNNHNVAKQLRSVKSKTHTVVKQSRYIMEKKK